MGFGYPHEVDELWRNHTWIIVDSGSLLVLFVRSGWLDWSPNITSAISTSYDVASRNPKRVLIACILCSCKVWLFFMLKLSGLWLWFLRGRFCWSGVFFYPDLFEAWLLLRLPLTPRVLSWAYYGGRISWWKVSFCCFRWSRCLNWFGQPRFTCRSSTRDGIYVCFVASFYFFFTLIGSLGWGWLLNWLDWRGLPNYLLMTSSNNWSLCQLFFSKERLVSDFIGYREVDAIITPIWISTIPALPWLP